MTDESASCSCCGAHENLVFFPKYGFTLCTRCLRIIVRILTLCRNGIGEDELLRKWVLEG
jgi:hypothetical protein